MSILILGHYVTLPRVEGLHVLPLYVTAALFVSRS
jgi:hypothetical protein